MKAKSAIAEVLNHLTYLGYKIKDKRDGSFLAKHDIYLNLLLTDKGTGVFIYLCAAVNVSDDDRPNYLDCINNINADAIVLRFYAGSDNDLMGDVWFPNYYNKVGFSAFMDLLVRDMQLLFSDRYGLVKYCG